MTSKQRVRSALEHRRPDRVPIDLGMARELQASLQQHLGLDEKGLWSWVGQDLELVGPSYPAAASPLRYADPTIEVTAEGFYADIWHVPFRQAKTERQTYMELAGRPPLKRCESSADLDAFHWPSADDWDYSCVAEDIRALGDRAAWGHSRGFFEIAHFMRGMDDFLTDLALRPELACELMDRIADFLLAKTRRTLEAAQGGFAFFEYNDDVASQRALFVSPTMWRNLIKPRMAKFCDLIHGFGCKVRYHSCGSVYAILPDLIEIGVDILTPVQAKATDMDPFLLKEKFGDRLCFHGGIDIQEFLPNASCEEVRRHTRRMIDVVGRNGGYLLAGSHTLQADIPVRNVVAMIEEAQT
jgi:uroporphyrinogen decarboxylase